MLDKFESVTTIYPWVKVNRISYLVVQLGTFEELNNQVIEGHIMTLENYKQICEERGQTYLFDNPLIKNYENAKQNGDNI